MDRVVKMMVDNNQGNDLFNGVLSRVEDVF